MAFEPKLLVLVEKQITKATVDCRRRTREHAGVSSADSENSSDMDDSDGSNGEDTSDTDYEDSYIRLVLSVVVLFINLH